MNLNVLIKKRRVKKGIRRKHYRTICFRNEEEEKQDYEDDSEDCGGNLSKQKGFK